MDNASLLVVAMAEQCRSRIRHYETPNVSLPRALQPNHLLWMCDQIEQHAERGPAIRLHRWLGFIQSAMMAHGMLTLDDAKAMFDKAKVAYREDNDDFLDHLDPTVSYEPDVGGEG